LSASWFATALGALLAIAAPFTATAVQERASVPSEATPVAGVVRAQLRPSAHPAERGALAPEEAPAPEPFLLVHARPGLVARAFPGADARTIGAVAPASKYYGVPLVLWVEETRKDGRWGRVELPYAFPRRDGWIRLDGLDRETTWVRVEVDLSERVVRVYRRERLVLRTPGAIGAPSSPTPPGEYVVTDRVPFAAGGYLGSFAFGISGIQPRLPAGWTGGNQLAIHGTNSPGTIGQAVSAGCVRVSEPALARLRPLLRLGTPVVIHR
jgi:lipoprotein-anchoring transpeptidase ErfK/SrfK